MEWRQKLLCLTQELACSIYIGAGPCDSEGFWQWLSLWFSVSSSDIRVNDILDRLLGGGLCGWRTHLGFNKLPSPAGVLVSLPLLCKLRKRFFSHLQGWERDRDRDKDDLKPLCFFFSFLFKLNHSKKLSSGKHAVMGPCNSDSREWNTGLQWLS